MIVGISGVALAGKNLFAAKLNQKLTKLSYKVNEYSFAYQLRKELEPILKKNFGFDVWTQNAEEKALIRPMLTFWAAIRRRQSKGTYFWEKTWKKIKKNKHENDINLITDCRFAEWKGTDEADFVKANGILIHLRKYEIINGKKHFQPPANDFEKVNDPKIRKSSDVKIDWPNALKSPYEVNLDVYVDGFIKKYEYRFNRKN